MKTFSRGPKAAAFAALALSAGPAFAAAFFTPHIEWSAGYESNRFEEADAARGSPSLSLAPGLEFTFAGRATEMALRLDYRRTDFLESGFDAQQEATLFGGWRRVLGRAELTLRAGGGFFRDGALSGNDYDFLQADAEIVHPVGDLPLEWALRGQYLPVFYRDTSDTTPSQEDRLARAETELRWFHHARTTIWAGVFAQRNGSDNDSAEYLGWGGTLGFESRLTPRLALGGRAEWSGRTYAESAGGSSASGEIRSLALWLNYRSQPAFDWFAEFGGKSETREPENETIAAWHVSCGMRVTFEWRL